MKLSRPPYVLAFPGDLAGCGYHRVMRPLQIMGRMGYSAGRAEVSFPEDRVVEAIRPDVVLWQRQSEESQIAVMERYRKLLPDAFFVYELDDALSSVPKASWHNPYMIPNIDAKLGRAIQYCDAVTVSTQPLAEHMRKFSGKVPVRVVPNMLGRDDLELASGTRREAMKQSPSTGKLRVGFGGGIGHKGDLALLNEVFSALADRVEWCFLGMDPEMPSGVQKSFFGAVTPERYLPSLASLNLDLVIAPLERNHFNECKSNLRLLEAGACMYPTIATKIDPYLTDSPPVFAYADDPDSWIAAIESFIALPADIRAANGKAMFDWVASKYIMDDRAEERLQGWLPSNARVFKPRLNVKGSGVAIVSTVEEFVKAFESSEDILYTRADALVSQECKNRLLACDLDIACALSNEGGPWGFPTQSRFAPLDVGMMEDLSRLLAQFEEAKPIALGAVSGPLVSIKRSVLDAIGLPDFTAGSIELAILEWSCAARARGLKIGLCPSAFAGVQSPSVPTQQDAQLITLRTAGRWPQGQNDDAALRSLYQEIELAFHRDHYRALPSANRSDYPAWTDMCDTRGPDALERANTWAGKNRQAEIGEANYPKASSGDFANAEWYLFTPKDACLVGDAHALMQLAIKTHPTAEIIYFDHDYTFDNQPRMNPDFKPNFDLHMLLSRDYISSAVMIRSSLCRDRFPLDTVIDDSSIYAAVLEALAENRIARTDIAHFPQILATLSVPSATDVLQAAPFKHAAAQNFVRKSGWGIAVNPIPSIPLLRSLRYSERLSSRDSIKPVVIIVPCKDNLEMLAPCISTILSLTTYPNYRILIVDNGSTRPDFLEYLSSLDDPRIVKTSWPHPYSWSALNNWAVDWYLKHIGHADYVCFLNDDTRVLTAEWLTEMVGAASLPEVGAVGARLTYPHGQVQHVGVVAQAGLTGHIHKGLPANVPGVQGYAIISHESTAVTGACLVVSHAKYTEVGGFSLELPHNFNDVAFCLDLLKRGYVNVVAACAELQHFEGVTRNAHGLTQQALQLLNNEGAILAKLHPEPDPYWNPNLLILFVQDGRQIAGMDQACYVFPGNPLPWTSPDIQRVLLLGPMGPALPELHDNYSIYQLDVVGNNAHIKSPPMHNCGPWDIRRPDIAVSTFKKLGIEKIIITRLDEAPIQTLQFLRKLNLPIEYRPVNAEVICPRGDFRITVANSSADPKAPATCNGGYKRGECQSCMDTQSSPHGNVLVSAWRAEWIRFLQNPVTADLSYLEDETYLEALQEAFARPQA